MKKLVLVCGPAGIGKSTFCKTYQSEHPDEQCLVIAADEVRKTMTGGYDKFPPNHNMMVIYERMLELAEEALDKNDSVTIMMDTTMLYDERRLYFYRNLPHFDYYSLYLLKVHDINTCLERNKMRSQEKWVPEHVIIDMNNKYLDPSPECRSKFNSVKEVYVD